MKTWIKAGAIGAAISIFFSLLSRILYFFPSNAINVILGLITCVPFLLIYPATGVLSAYWLPFPRTVQQGAKAGTLAGLVIGVADGIISMILDIALPLTGTVEQLNQLQQLLNKERTFAIFIGAAVCSKLIFLVLAMVLSGLGGAVYVAIKKEPKASETESIS